MNKYFSYIALALLALVPLLGLNSYLMHILILVVMWSVIGMSWNLLSGYCGQVSFGHAAFFGVGAYTSGMLYTKLGISGWWGLPASIVVVTLFALVIGYICLRLRGPYFALATLSIGVILRIVAENIVDVTGGDLGIMIRERSWIDTTLYKTIALCLSAMITGFAGAFYTNYMGYIDPKVVFALHDISIIAIMVVMVGGVATFSGPIVGAIIMVVLAESIRSIPMLGNAHHTVFGILLIVIIIFLPNGIVGDFSKLKKLVGSRGGHHELP